MARFSYTSLDYFENQTLLSLEIWLETAVDISEEEYPDLEKDQKPQSQNKPRKGKRRKRR